jgi:peptidoglycan L-alanyl-D-glutamate endopeptidase CwlK
MASRDPQHLHPAMRNAFTEFMRRCENSKELKARGITVIVTCTYRSNEEQAELYAQGRTKPGSIVTWAKPGESLHNLMFEGKPGSKAFDIAILRNGKITWSTAGNGIDDDPSDDMTDDLEAWQLVGAIGESINLEWAGRWPKSKREFPHFQLRW